MMKKKPNEAATQQSPANDENETGRATFFLHEDHGNSQEGRIRIMSESHTTTDHDIIRRWAADRHGRPATVKATEEDGHAGILRIDFGPKDEGLDPIDWDEFFRKFDESELAFLYQDRTKDGKLSRFHKFVRRAAN